MRAAVILVALAFALPIPAQPLSLDQVMADPDWIGNPVEAAWWQLDGKAVTWQQKRTGSTIRDRIVLDLASGNSAVAAPAQDAALDPANPVFDRAHQRAVFVRNGDVFMRELGSGALRQLTASADAEASPMFSADEQAALWRVRADIQRRRGARDRIATRGKGSTNRTGSRRLARRPVAPDQHPGRG